MKLLQRANTYQGAIMTQLLIHPAEADSSTIVAGAHSKSFTRQCHFTQPRSIFVSDVHLGCKYGNTERFFKFLCSYEPQYLYLVGDMLDGWRLSRNWYWTDCYNQIIHRINELAANGTKIYYTPGNHDEFLRSFLGATILVGNIQIANEFVHVTADDRRLLVTHGDQFDTVVQGHRLLSNVGDQLYNLALLMNRQVNRVRRSFGRRNVYFSKYLKQKAKQFTNSACGFESAVVDYAKRRDCHGIVCGHIHQPDIKIDPSGIVYYNTGDWVENASSIIESNDGQLAIVHSSEDA
jgi:UDP-2,3-diacylglucosamine pyrophosphatase LpxH